MEWMFAVVIGGVNFRSAVVASLLGAYIMAFLGYWLDGVFGLGKVDFAQFGKVYVGENPGWWTIGMATHFLTKMLWGILLCWMVSPPRIFPLLPEWLFGLLFGLVLGVFLLLVGVVGKSLGGKAFDAMPKATPERLSYILLYAIFGFFVGVFYTVPTQ